MNILIVGLGSIAKKHIKAIREIQPDANIMALRTAPNAETEQGIKNLYSWREVPRALDFIIISNPTKFHKEAIINAIRFRCPLFIEKPVLANVDDATEIVELLKDHNSITYVACNLRFHPSILYLKNNVDHYSGAIDEVNVYCGSNLALWRPSQDYTQSYSAQANMGGGVHLDLIHEIDYCYWLFGRPLEVHSVKRKVSSLAIDSYDFASYTLVYPNYTINIVLNYYRKKAKRSLEIVSEDKIVYADLSGATLVVDERILSLQPSFNMEETYFGQMKYFIEHVRAGKQPMNSFGEALEVLKITLQ